MESIVFYVYHESVQDADNLRFFLRHGLVPHVHFVFIIHGEECSVELPSSENSPEVTILRRPNTFDLVGFCNVLEEHFSDTIQQYGYIFFLNSSCRGPFLSPVITTYSPHWTQIFISLLQNTDSHMVAPVIEIPPLDIECLDTGHRRHAVPFLHTYMFCIDHKALHVLREKIFPLLKVEGISRTDLLLIERQISACLLFNGLRIHSLLLKYRDVDWLDRRQWNYGKWAWGMAHTGGGRMRLSCPEIPGNYGGIDIHPLEVIFFKNIRQTHDGRRKSEAGISEDTHRILERYTSWLRQK